MCFSIEIQLSPDALQLLMSPVPQKTLCPIYITHDMMHLQNHWGEIRPDAEHIYSQVINAMRALWNTRPHWLPCVGGAQGVKCMSACLCALELAMMASIRAN